MCLSFQTFPSMPDITCSERSSICQTFADLFRLPKTSETFPDWSSISSFLNIRKLVSNTSRHLQYSSHLSKCSCTGPVLFVETLPIISKWCHTCPDMSNRFQHSQALLDISTHVHTLLNVLDFPTCCQTVQTFVKLVQTFFTLVQTVSHILYCFKLVADSSSLSDCLPK